MLQRSRQNRENEHAKETPLSSLLRRLTALSAGLAFEVSAVDGHEPITRKGSRGLESDSAASGLTKRSDVQHPTVPCSLLRQGIQEPVELSSDLKAAKCCQHAIKTTLSARWPLPNKATAEELPPFLISSNTILRFRHATSCNLVVTFSLKPFRLASPS